MQVVEEREVRHRAKKDTKRWCKGKVGREHKFTEPIQLYPTHPSEWRASYLDMICFQCGTRKIVFT